MNQINPAFLRDFNQALDLVVSCQEHIYDNNNNSRGGGGGCALLTVGEGKYWSTGLDLNWLSRHSQTNEGQTLMPLFQALVKRLLVFSMPSVAVLNGHCSAGSFMLAMAHDYRVMNSDKGWMQLPAISIHLPLPKGLLALVRAKIALPSIVRKIVLEGHKYNGPSAKLDGLVDECAGQHNVLAFARHLALSKSQGGKDGSTYSLMKKSLYFDVITLLDAAMPADLEVCSIDSPISPSLLLVVFSSIVLPVVLF